MDDPKHECPTPPLPEDLERLAATFREASQRRTNVIDPPFDCVTVNLEPESWAKAAIKAALSRQAATTPVGEEGWRPLFVDLAEVALLLDLWSKRTRDEGGCIRVHHTQLSQVAARLAALSSTQEQGG